MTARHLTTVSLAVASILACLRALYPSPEERAAASYALVLTIGYGHLLGALLGGRHKFAAALPAPLANATGLILLASSVPLLLHTYVITLAALPALLWPLLAVSTWHICENECAIAEAHGGRLGSPWRGWRRQIVPAAATALVLFVSAAALPAEDRIPLGRLALSLPDLTSRGVEFADVFAATTLFHLLSWLRVGTRRRSGLVLRVHVGVALLCGGVLTIPGEGIARAREAVFSPGLYLFWSALHVAQTSLGRTAGRRG